MIMMLMMMIMIMDYEWIASVWIGVYKEATQRPRQLNQQHTLRSGATLVSTVFFFHSYKFPLHNYFMSFVAKKQNCTLAFLSSLDCDQGSSEVNLEVQWNLSITKEGQETRSICSLYNEVSFIEILFHIFYYNSGKKNR